MNELQVFKNEEFGEIRTVEINNEVWFVGKDVADILGYTNASKALADHVDYDDKLNNESLSSLGQRGGWLINESGLYSLILSSKLPKAKHFKHWVTSEVLPSIRENGAYMTRETLDKALASPDFLIELATKLKEKQKQIDELNGRVIEQDKQIMIQDSVIREMQPKVSYVDTILNSKATALVTQIAQDYGMSAKKFNQLLHGFGIQHKVDRQWILYARYQGNGYVQSRTFDYEKADGTKDVTMNTAWTQKGRLFLYEFLKSHDVLPLIERGEI